MTIIMAIMAIALACVILSACLWWMDRDPELRDLDDFKDAFNQGVVKGHLEEGYLEEWVCHHYQRKDFASDAEMFAHLGHCYPPDRETP